MSESVNNGGGNRPLEVFCPTFCSKQGQADQVAQGSMQGNCEHLHGGGLHRFSLCTCSDLLQKAEDSSVCRCCLDGKTEDALGKASASHFVALCPHSIHQLEANRRSHSGFHLSSPYKCNSGFSETHAACSSDPVKEPPGGEIQKKKYFG